MSDIIVPPYDFEAPIPVKDVGNHYPRPSSDYPVESDATPLNTNYFGDDGWQWCTGPSLRGHIVNAHLQPHILDGIGLPLFDIEVAKVRGIGLGWVVFKAIKRLELGDGELSDYLAERGVNIRMTVADYRLAVVKTIGLISQQGMAQVPWIAVNRVYKGASEVTINPAQECDMSFLETHQGKQALQEAEARKAVLAQNVILQAECVYDEFRVKID